MEYDGAGDNNYDWCTQNNLQRIGKGMGRLENKSTSRDHSDYSICKIGQNTEKSPGNADVKNYQKSKMLIIIKMKLINTWKYWKQTPSNKWR